MKRSLLDPVTYKGIKYKDGKALCKAFNISIPDYRNRYIRSGWSIEDVIEKTIKRRNYAEVKDHKGISYKSETEMCHAYEIPYHVYVGRKKRCKMTLEEMLTNPVSPTESKEHTNPLTGEYYSSERKMAKALGIARWTLQNRFKRGFEDKYLYAPKTKERLQREGNKIFKPCSDHKGNNYTTKKAMCSAYGIGCSTFDARIKKGLPLQEALEAPVQDRGPKRKVYTIDLIFDSEKELWLATSKDIPDLTVKSKSYDELMKKLKDDVSKILKTNGQKMAKALNINCSTYTTYFMKPVTNK